MQNGIRYISYIHHHKVAVWYGFVKHEILRLLISTNPLTPPTHFTHTLKVQILQSTTFVILQTAHSLTHSLSLTQSPSHSSTHSLTQPTTHSLSLSLLQQLILPLHVAVNTNRLDIVTVLLKHDTHGVDRPSKFGETPLHFACMNGNLEMVKLLVR